MPKEAATTRSSSARGDSYLEQSKKPLHILVFLIPAIAFYAIGSIVFASGVMPAAEQTIGAIFGVFGVVGMHLPSLALIAFLIIHHLIRRDSWKLSVPALPMMLVESAAWVVPLLVLSRALEFGGPLADAAVDPASIGLGARLTLGVGAGLFEETLYRLVLITLIHLLAVDVVGLKDMAGWVVSILASSVIFAMVHRVPGDLAADATMVRVFYFAAASFFGVLFATRGLGIAVGAHVIYDIAALA